MLSSIKYNSLLSMNTFLSGETLFVVFLVLMQCWRLILISKFMFTLSRIA